MGVTLIVDNREHGVIKMINTISSLKELMSVSQLPVGDFIINVSGKPMFIIERKTLADIAASIKDGRWREQKTRLNAWCQQNTQPIHHCIYIIEGKWEDYDGRLPSSTLKTAIINTLIRDGCRIIQTESVIDTVRILAKIIKCVGDLPVNPAPTPPTLPLLSVSVIKKKNITPLVCYIQQLACVPGLSIGIAKLICNVYPTLSQLIAAIQSNPAVLTQIRGIGKKLNQRIIQYFQISIDNSNNCDGKNE